MVNHVLSGISRSVYASSIASHNEVLKQTIMSMIGYDCHEDDIDIQLVTDTSYVPSRFLTATSNETTLIYSVNTPTRVFNDIHQATAWFIQALNESVTTGAFDTLLHAEAASGSLTDLQSATTAYITFSTASPTSSPTSVPSFSPTNTDIVDANLLNIPLNAAVTKAKVQYYLGTFVGYFLFIYICLYLYSFLQYGKETAKRLYDSSYRSEAYIRYSAITIASNSDVSPLSDLCTKNTLVQDTMRLEEELKAVKQTVAKSTKMEETERVYSKGFREYVQQQRTLLGCSPLLYPDGCVVTIPCTSKQIHLPPGRVENMLLFIAHNHQLFSCFYFMDGSKLGAHGSRILYIGKDIAVFVLYQFSNMLLQYFMLDGIGLGIFINLFVITPSAVAVGLLLKYLYVCPFTETVEFQRKYAKYEVVILFIGRLAILPIMFIMGSSLVLACLFSSGRRIPMILVDYFLYVQFYGVLLAVAKAIVLFIDEYYYRISIFGFDFCIGSLFKERVVAEQMVADVDYAFRVNSYMFGVIIIEKILNRADAIKANWITIASNEKVDIEMTGASIGDDDVGVVQNPLNDILCRDSNVNVFSIDTIYDTSEHTHISTTCTTNDSVLVMENPIHFTASAAPTESYQTASNRQEPLRLHQSAINTTSDNATVMDDDDDDLLYVEYQNLHSQHDDTVYSMTDEADVAITFEEWKTKRKQFKQGTRGSFVKAFQVWEEREQLLRDNIEQSASVKNTMLLHSSRATNALAMTRPK